LIVKRGVGYLIVKRGVGYLIVKRGVGYLIVKRGVRYLIVKRGVRYLIVKRGVGYLIVKRGVGYLIDSQEIQIKKCHFLNYVINWHKVSLVVNIAENVFAGQSRLNERLVRQKQINNLAHRC
jgi:hypothetical protein